MKFVINLLGRPVIDCDQASQTLNIRRVAEPRFGEQTGDPLVNVAIKTWSVDGVAHLTAKAPQQRDEAPAIVAPPASAHRRGTCWSWRHSMDLVL